MIKFIEKTNNDRPIISTVTLPWEMRIKSRQKIMLDNGQEAGVFLNRGEILRGSDRLINEDGDAIEVVAAKEIISTASTDCARKLNLACYHLGNRHVELEIGDTWVRYLHDHVLDDMVQGLGLEVKISLLPFEPETGAYGHHHHDH